MPFVQNNAYLNPETETQDKYAVVTSITVVFLGGLTQQHFYYV